MKIPLVLKFAALGALLIVSAPAFADPVIIISDGVTSTGPITLAGGSGTYFSGNFDNSWDLVVAAGQSKPGEGSVQDPNMELSITAHSLGSVNALTLIFSDNNFGPTTASMTASFSGHPIAGRGDLTSFDPS